MEITEKYTKPNRYDLGRYGEVCRNGNEYFIQVSKDPESACWLTLGEFYQRINPGSNLTNDFIQECLTLYEKKNEEPRVI